MKSKESAEFEKVLREAAQEERPPDYPGLTGENRRAASRSQFLTYSARYWADWRRSKVRMYRFLLEKREELLERERRRLETGGHHPETVVYQEMTNGLVAAAAAEVCQYAEDLGVLVYACDSDDYFARRVNEAHAGKIQRDVKEWAYTTRQSAAKALRIPYSAEEADWNEKNPIVKEYVLGLARARDRLKAIGRFYRDWELVFMNYKHGLMLSLRDPTGLPQTEEFLNSRRDSLEAAPWAFDCKPVNQAIDQDQQTGLVIPDVGEPSNHVRWNLAELAKERNLLRIVFPPDLDGEPHIVAFERVSSWISQLQRVLLRNRVSELSEQPEPYFVPHEDPDALLQFNPRK
jgi:hypothetical protein